MHTIEQLVSGELEGANRIKISMGLKDFPHEVFRYSETLEILDLTGNRLSSLPAKFSCLKKLKIAFFSENEFEEFPSVLSECPELEMIGFKSNRISRIGEGAIPVKTRWLILTNNRLTQLPMSIGKCYRLQKCMLAGNQLSYLPDEMSNCTQLELLRISANMFSSFPDWLFRLPKLSWLALGGNPGIESPRSISSLKEIEWADLEIVEHLGSGASGIISKARWKTGSQSEWVAVKEFKGEVTSDGLPKDEMMACIQAGFHPHLVKVLGKVVNHSQGKDALVLGLIPSNYSNLAGPPSFETCTRDVFPEGFTCLPDFLLKICRGIASASKQLHERGVSHGDLYAHNILIDELGNPLFGDFGAATIDESSKYPLLQNIEVRAFGCLMEDLIMNLDTSTDSTGLAMELQKIMENCLQADVERRPSFGEILVALNSIS